MPKTGTDLKNEGGQLALMNASEEWRDAVDAAIRRVGKHGPFTAEDVRADVEATYDGPPPASNNAWGGALLGASKTKLVKWTGQYRTSTRKEAHARPVKLWELVNGGTA